MRFVGGVDCLWHLCLRQWFNIGNWQTAKKDTIHLHVKSFRPSIWCPPDGLEGLSLVLYEQIMESPYSLGVHGTSKLDTI